MKRWMRRVCLWRVLGILLAVGLTSAPIASRAEMVGPQPDGTLTVYENSALISGKQTSIGAFFIPYAGTVTVTLSDLAWPQKLANLSFLLTDVTTIFTHMTAPGTFSFELKSPGQFFGLVSGTAQGAMNLGLYSLRVALAPAQAPVPLPGAAVLLISGLAGFAALRRKRQQALAH